MHCIKDIFILKFFKYSYFQVFFHIKYSFLTIFKS